MTKEDIVANAKKALSVYFSCCDPNDWQNQYSCTTEGALAVLSLASMLLLKLEDDGLIIPFSHNIPECWNDYRNTFGESWCVDLERVVMSTAIYTAFTECGWIFPGGMNLIPSDEGDFFCSCSDGPNAFWTTSYDELPEEMILKIAEDNEFTDDPDDEEIIKYLNQDYEIEDPTGTDIALYRLQHACEPMSCLSFYNPKWHEVQKKFNRILECCPEKIPADLYAQYNALLRDVESFEMVNGCVFVDSVYIDGIRVFINLNYPWYDQDDSQQLFFNNLLSDINPVNIFEAPILRDRIEEVGKAVEELYGKSGAADMSAAELASKNDAGKE